MAKISLGSDPVAEGIYRDQSYWMLINGIVDESAIRALPVIRDSLSILHTPCRAA